MAKKIDTALIKSAILLMADRIEENKEYLTELDSAIGDADHGINMSRGFKKASEKIRVSEYADMGSILKDLAMTMMSSVGGASGPLYGTFFMKFSQTLAGKTEAGLIDIVKGLDNGLQGIISLGKAQLGDKTMVDALIPALVAIKKQEEDGADLQTALESALEAAENGKKTLYRL